MCGLFVCRWYSCAMERTQEELKIEFAKAWLRYPDDPYAAAKFAFPGEGNRGLALQAAYLWVNDSFVLEQRKQLIEIAPEVGLPGKEDQLRDLYAIAANQEIDPKERVAAHKLYAEIKGYLQQKGPEVNVTLQSVMLVKDHGSDAEWEERARAQQRTLIADGSSAAN